MGRSGTTLVQKSLAAHPNVYGPEFEVTDALFTKGIGIFIHQQVDELVVQSSMGRQVQALIGEPVASASSMGLLKHTSNSPYGTGFALKASTEWLDKANVIIVRRRDPLAKLASHLCAVRNDMWHTLPGQKINSDYYRPFRIPTCLFKIYVENHLKIMELYEKYRKNTRVLIVDYETINSPKFPYEIENLLKFVGLPEGGDLIARPPLEKMAPDPSVFVKNCSELRKIQSQMERRYSDSGSALSKLDKQLISLYLKLSPMPSRIRSFLSKA